MQLGPLGVKLITEWEGFRSYAYQDSVGVWTIGYGTTAGAGVAVHPWSHCTEAQARAWVYEYCDRDVIPAIREAFRVRNSLHPHSGNPFPSQVDALCSAGYNLGPGVFDSGRSLGDAIRNGRSLHDIGVALMEYVYAGGNVLPGLVNRRTAERRLLLRDGRLARS
jgi:lysozyme